MKVTHDYVEFFNATGTIFRAHRIKKLGIANDDLCASFWPDEMENVLDFCAHHTDYHVVSYLGEGVYINRYDERGLRFQLADGDNDPEYMLNAMNVIAGILPKHLA